MPPTGQLKFTIDTHPGFPVDLAPWPEFLRANDIAVESTTDLPGIGRAMDAHEFDIGFVPLADLLRRVARRDRHYRGLAIATRSWSLDEAVADRFLDVLVDWIPSPEAVFAAFRPFYFADVQAFYHDLARLPADA